MEFGLLGPLEVIEQSEVLLLGGPKQRTVLVHLLLRANRPVSQEQLVDLVWGEDPPPTARGSLQSYVSRLRTALGPSRLDGRGGAYVLHAGPDEVDTTRFEALVREARCRAASDPAAAAATYRTALDLWRGPALGDLATERSLQPEIARLEELRLTATEERIEIELALGRHRELAADLETLIGRDPFRERLWGQLMVALYRSGRQRDALAAYGRVRATLADELGLDPSPELQRLRERILNQDPALDVAARPLRGYRLLERVGAGTFGTVHRAFQSEVGREVAVKIVRPELANRPEFVRRFGSEAQLVARLEHPHIVPLYDYWREPEGAYLVMRYLRGGSLREQLAQGALEPGRVVALIEHVALALAAAHRQGVVHRDVKPANILFDDDGNAYLSDFGIAKDLAVADGGGWGALRSPLAAYLSPEEARGEPVTPKADVYGLGVVAFEALAGRHPFADTPPGALVEKHAWERLPPLRSLRPELSPAVDAVIACATTKDPAERPGDAVALAVALRDALAPVARRRAEQVAPIETRNPYKGLRPFFEADAADFFGREAAVEELVARLADQGPGARFLAVVGPSGSGKSSLVRAGVAPALRRGAIAGSDRWFVVEMHPGAHPFEELAAAVARVAVAPADGLVDRLEHGEGLAAVVAELLPAPDAELVLVVDQFEEVFTLVDAEDERGAFLRALVDATGVPGGCIRVVVTLRADFYDRPLSHPGLAELMQARTAVVTPLSPGEMERAIAGPAEAVGVSVDPALVAALVADAADQPAPLPLLQFAITEIFEQRDRGRLTLDAYRSIGGVSGALARRAEDVYGGLPPPGQEAARQLFLRLVTVGEEGSEDTRRRVLRAELHAIEGEREAMEAAVDAFGARRLLSFDRDPATRGPTVEVAHEALLREWGRLQGWIEAARDDLRAHRRLAAAAGEWVDGGRDDSFLLSGDRLRRYETWADTAGLSLTGIERSYLDASVARREAERAREQIRADRERKLERRSMMRLRGLVVVLAALALVGSGLTALTLDQRSDARREARVANARELAAAAVADLDQDPERSVLLALEAVDVTREDGIVLPEAEEALHRAVKSSRTVRTVPQGGFGVAASSDGTRFVTGGSHPDDPAATVWDTETGEELVVLAGPTGLTGRSMAELRLRPGVAFSPDDRLIATTHDDGTVRLWDASSGAELHVLRGHDGVVGLPTFSPDGDWLATGGEDTTVRIWNVSTATQKYLLTGHPGAVSSTAFSPDGSRLVAAADQTALVWDVASGEVVTALTGHAWDVGSAVFSPDGRHVATASIDAHARIWNAETGTLVQTFAAPTSLQAVALSPDGTRLAAVGTDANAIVWDVQTGREMLTLAGHTGALINVAFTPDGNRLLTSGADDTTRVWDVSAAGARDWLTVPGVELIYAGVAFSPDGRTFAAPAGPAGVTIWDAASGEEVIHLAGYERKLSTVAFSPDGSMLVAGSDVTESPPVWDVRTGDLLFTLAGHSDMVRAVAFSPDGTRIVTGGWDGTARVWEAATGAPLDLVRSTGGGIPAVAFSTDGRLLVAGEQTGDVQVWDATTLTPVRTLRGHTGPVLGVTFGPGGMLVTTSEDGTAKVWDVASGAERVTFRGHRAIVNQAAVSPDGTRVATSGEDATTKLWDPATGQEQLTLVGHDYLVYGVDFSPDGRRLATASPDGTVALHLLPLDELADLARERVTRDFTAQECRDYLHVQTCPAPS